MKRWVMATLGIGACVAACGPAADTGTVEPVASGRAPVLAVQQDAVPDGYQEAEILNGLGGRALCRLHLRPAGAPDDAWSPEMIGETPVGPDESAFVFVDASVPAWDVEVEVCADEDYGHEAYELSFPGTTFSEGLPFILADESLDDGYEGYGDYEGYDEVTEGSGPPEAVVAE